MSEKSAIFNKYHICDVKFCYLITLPRYSGYEFSKLEDGKKSENYILSRIPRLLRIFCSIKWRVSVS